MENCLTNKLSEVLIRQSMDQLVRALIQSKTELNELKDRLRNATTKLMESEKTLAAAMTHRSLKSVQSFDHKLTLNCNAETIRLYFWKTSYNDPTDNDVTKYKELISLVRAFLYARNEKLQVTQEINDCEKRIKRRTDRIIKKAPTNRDNIQCTELKCTIKLNRPR